METKALLVGGRQPLWNTLASQVEKHVTSIVRATACTEGFRVLQQGLDIDLAIVHSEQAIDCGLKFLRAVRNDSRLDYIPVILAGTSFGEATIVQYHDLRVHDVILLPVNDITLEAKITQAKLDSRPTVVIVDDEPMIAELVSNFVEMERMRPVVFHSGQDALNFIEEAGGQVHVVITDILMPDISGLEVLIKIKSDYSHIPVVMITGHGGQFTPRMAIESGADGYFSKPFHNMELMYTIRRVLSLYHPKYRRQGAPTTPTRVDVRS